MMRIGIVSDTHMPKGASALPPVLVSHFRGVDLIIHLGDWTDMDVYRQLSALAPVEGVAGNNDPREIVQQFGYHKIIQLGSHRVGLTHGFLPAGRGTAQEKAMRIFEGRSLDAILFGHSHKPLLKKEKGLLLFNPGSPTDKRREPKYSFGLLQISGETLKAKHIYMERKL
ncbi:metallophosphoesterase family protein [Paenibacillus aceti]|uniref:Phosphoesterase n=1 Tax=Paenibacillus aceti TaxID=1820010 RepID=A0ABQ1W0L6_9BACL|nr:metallophosphoesterase family protein [Paenibacillus aceti]GGG05840.1 phosphoesterase [Paenibacillus aceti]